MFLYTIAWSVDSEYVFSNWISGSELLLRFKMKGVVEEEGRIFAEKNRSSRHGRRDSFGSSCTSDDSCRFSASPDECTYS